MPKTNKERLQENNDRLEVVKTKVDDLPKYQNLEPIYGTRTYDFITHPESLNTANLSIDRLGPFYAIRCGGNKVYYLYQYKDGVWKNLWYTTSSSYTRYFVLLDYDDTNVYFTFGSSPSGNVYADTPITVTTLNLETLETTSKSIPANYGYSPSHNIGRGLYTNGSNIYYYDKDNKTISKYMSDVIYFSNATYTSPDIMWSSGDNKLVKIDLVNKVTTSKVFDLSGVEEFAGVSYEGDLVFTKSGKCYQLSSTLGVDELIVNDINLGDSITGYIYCLDDKYYYCNGHIYTFNRTTYKFTSVIDVTLSNSGSNGVFYKSSNVRNIYYSTTGTTEIGFTYKGKRYLYATNRNFLTTSNVLTGYDAYNEAGDLISGTMPNNGTLNYTPSSSVQTIPAGYTSGGTISAIDYSAQGAVSPADTETAEEQIADLFGEEE